MEILKYQSVDYQLAPEKRQKVDEWIKVESKNNPVGVFGASVEQLIYALQTGELPPYDALGGITYPWQRKIIASGKHLYYATAILPGIEQANASLARKVRKGYKGIDLDEILLKGARRTGVSYANEMALTDAFIRQFAAYRTNREIWALTTTLFPTFSQEESVVKHPATRDLDTLDFRDPLEGEDFKEGNLTLQQFKDRLVFCFKRLGVLWYYNDKIFEHEVVPGVESENEIMIIPKRPLTLDVISGIEMLGSEEKKLLIAS